LHFIKITKLPFKAKYYTAHERLLWIINRLNSYQHLPSQSEAKLYNILHENLKSDQSIRPLKNKLKTFLIDNSFYSVDEFTEHWQKIKKIATKLFKI
jgi:hypothetical protein